MNVAKWAEWFPDLFSGLLTSLQLTAIVLLLGLPLGLVFGLAGIARSKGVRWVCIGFVDLLRGVPLLVLLYIVYFGLPSVGLTISAWVSAIIAIGANTAAYSSEIFRAGLLSVARGQIEAGESLGLTRVQVLRRIVVPQAIRTVTPPIVSHSILVFHGTSLASVIAVSELTASAYYIGAITFDYLSVLALAGILYAIVSIGVAHAVQKWRGDQHGLRALKRRGGALL